MTTLAHRNIALAIRKVREGAPPPAWVTRLPRPWMQTTAHCTIRSAPWVLAAIGSGLVWGLLFVGLNLTISFFTELDGFTNHGEHVLSHLRRQKLDDMFFNTFMFSSLVALINTGSILWMLLNTLDMNRKVRLGEFRPLQIFTLAIVIGCSMMNLLLV
ncbi:hypothetical protein JNJ66_01755 [Candidatus Saccharibacteria bacterium]|nr:hypothetical protein [Candidatus Saccharibacteria bacterium]